MATGGGKIINGPAKAPPKYEYGDVRIMLENCILPEERLFSTPSMRDGLDKEIEIDLRIVGCEYIQIAGILLKLPQVLAFPVHCDLNSCGLVLRSFLHLEPLGCNGYSSSFISALLLF